MTRLPLPHREEVVELLSRLVACPSVNPNDRPVTGPPFGEDRLAALLRELLAGWGAEVELVEVLPRRPNLIAKFPGAKPAPRLMLEAHADTVSAEGMSIPPFDPRVNGDLLYGRGACDDKGSMAAMLLAIRSVLDSDGRPPSDVYFVAACNEERGASGARALMESGFRADAAIVGEPTNLEIVLAHKGVLRWRLRTKGVAAHSATPEEGVNAISMMARVIQRLESTLAERLREKSHPSLGHPTLTVGTIRGGVQVNIVPAECEIEIDRRLLPHETPEQAEAELKAEIALLKRELPQLDCEVERTEYYPPMESDKERPPARCAAAACEAVLGEARFAAAPWGADSGHFSRAGIPSVLFGPGSIDQAHKAEEYVSLSQVALASVVYARIIQSFPVGWRET